MSLACARAHLVCCHVEQGCGCGCRRPGRRHSWIGSVCRHQLHVGPGQRLSGPPGGEEWPPPWPPPGVLESSWQTHLEFQQLLREAPSDWQPLVEPSRGPGARPQPCLPEPSPPGLGWPADVLGDLPAWAILLVLPFVGLAYPTSWHPHLGSGVGLWPT